MRLLELPGEAELTVARRRVPERVLWAVATLSALAVLGAAVGLAAQGALVDITVYLAGGAHFFSKGLYSLKVPPQGLLFTYPPFAALTFVPLAHLPAVLARVIWAAVSACSLIVLIAVCLRAVRPAWPTRRVWQLALLASGPAALLDPILVNFQLGQVNLLLDMLVVADLLGRDAPGEPLFGPLSRLRRPAVVEGRAGEGGAGEGREGRAGEGRAGDAECGRHARLPQGVLVGVAAAVKLTPLVLVPYLLLVGKRRAAAWAAGTFAVCEGVAFLGSPSSSSTYWTKDLFNASRAGGIVYISDQNLRTMLDRLHHAMVPDSLGWALGALVGIVCILVAAAAYRRSSPMLGLLVCEATGLVISPITWVHHLVWVVPVVIWLALAAERPAAGPSLALGTLVLFWAAPIWWVPHTVHRELHENALEFVVGNSFFFATVAFIAAVGVMLLQRRRPARSPSVP